MIEQLYAIIGTDPKDGIVVVANPSDGSPLPMVSPNLQKIIGFYPDIKAQEERLEKTFKVVRFDCSEDITKDVELELFKLQKNEQK